MNVTFELEKAFNIPHELAAALISVGKTEVHLADNVIRAEDQYFQQIYFILSGVAHIDTFREGSYHYHNFAVRGQIFNLSSLFSPSRVAFRMKALSDVRVLCIDIKKAKDFFDTNANFARLISFTMSQRLIAKTIIIEMHRLKCNKSKIKTILYLLFSHSKSDNLILTTSQIADLTATSRNTATKVLKQFENEGQINLGYRSITKGEAWDEEWHPHSMSSLMATE